MKTRISPDSEFCFTFTRGGHYHRPRVTSDQDEIKRSSRFPGENQTIKVTCLLYMYVCSGRGLDSGGWSQ